jgi:CRISPR-associated endonuclease/helicase Cas3
VKRKNQHESKLIIDCIEFLQYSSTDEEAFTLEKFKLLDDKYFEMDVFIEVDETAQNLWKRFTELYRDDTIDRFERKKKFAEFKTDFYNYVISIPKNASNRPVDFFGELAHVSLDELDYYYDLLTGFKLKPDIFTEVI